MIITIIPNRLAGADIPRLYHLIKKYEHDLMSFNRRLLEIKVDTRCLLPDMEFSGESSQCLLSEDDTLLTLTVYCPEAASTEEVCRLISHQMEAVRQVSWAWAWTNPPKKTGYGRRYQS